MAHGTGWRVTCTTRSWFGKRFANNGSAANIGHPVSTYGRELASRRAKWSRISGSASIAVGVVVATEVAPRFVERADRLVLDFELGMVGLKARREPLGATAACA